jgi:hypothetical protein
VTEVEVGGPREVEEMVVGFHEIEVTSGVSSAMSSGITCLNVQSGNKRKKRLT